MSICRSAIWLAACLVLLAWTASARAQREIHHIPPWIDPDGRNPDFAQPFIEPLAFDPDWEFFAPAEVGEFGGGPDPNVGWFGTYERLYIRVSRPDDQDAISDVLFQRQIYQAAESVGGDFAWGNRYDVGYMTQENHGWLLSFWHIGGPNVNDVREIERVNVFEEDDEINSDPTSTVVLRGGGGQQGGGGQMMMNQMRLGVPPRDANDPITGYRSYFVTNSINDAKMSSFELNKTIRLKKLAYGSIIEPFFGFRYVKFDNLKRNDVYRRFNEDDDGMEFMGILDSMGMVIDPDDLSIEQLESALGYFNNYMVGGQIGMRWYKQKARWNLSGEVRAFAFQNFQVLNSTLVNTLTFYEGGGVGDDVEAQFIDKYNFAGSDTEFVFGGEVRANAAFQLTRDISILMGITFMEFGRGIGRDNRFVATETGKIIQILNNDQNVTMFGVNGGIVLNR